jgi:isoaspartyl peptidase/L-asparaginase-like protein (Ntn-hydrolase superfamily)
MTQSARTGWVVAVHGGASAYPPGEPEREAACLEALRESLAAGAAILGRGGTSLDAVEAAVRCLEACEHLNAGRGSTLSAAGEVEMDAAIADGAGRRAGAVAAVRRLVHPVTAARAVLEHGAHVLLVGEAADRFGTERGLEQAEPDFFVTPRARALWERERRVRWSRGAEGPAGPETVGAVALDAAGHLAAATSTGGLAGKLPGRVSDSALIGAGTWADDATCAVSATGRGELFIRSAFAHEVDALLRLAGRSLGEACREALARVTALGGAGGCVAVDRGGALATPFTTPGMLCGSLRCGGEPYVALRRSA